MANYKIILTPAGSYFFGNEKSFRYPGQKNGSTYSNSYFIRSENIPSQSTILGTLRFALMPCVKTDFLYSDEDKKANSDAVGEESFDITKGKQSFGKIKKISPVFIIKEENTSIYSQKETKAYVDELAGVLIPAPLDHQLKPEKENDGEKVSVENSKYTPFCFYKEEITTEGKKLIAEDYDVKQGLADGFVFIAASDKPEATGTFIKASDIIGSETRVGINRSNKNDGYFKKEYKYLKPGFSFAVYAEVDDDSLDGTQKIVCLGQGKTPFSMAFVKEDSEDFYKKVENVLSSNRSNNYSFIYCLGDTAVKSSPYNNTLFAAIGTKDYRSFSTHWNGAKEKGNKLIRLVKAGSIFITGDPTAWKTGIGNNENAEQIGYNKFIIIGGENHAN